MNWKEKRGHCGGTCTLDSKLAIHAGKPCDDLNCHFRKAIEPARTAQQDSRYEAELRAAILTFRQTLLTPVAEKVAYVRSEVAKPVERKHFCHVPDCRTPCAPAHLMCAPHWRAVPKPLQQAVWAHYRPGQEADFAPLSEEYLDAAQAAIAAVHDPQRSLF